MEPDSEMTIGQLAVAVGVNVETVRYYERRGLIRQPPTPRHGGARQYDSEHLRRIRFVKRAQQLGFSLDEIDDLLSLRANETAECDDVRSRAEVKVADIRARIRSLHQIEAALVQLAEECRESGHGHDCPILNALDPDL